MIRNVEIADQAADGINVHRGVRRVRIESNRLRNSGDDAIASWSEGIANEDILIRSNRISAPGLANGIALYGGRNLDVEDNRIADILIEGGGIHLGARFSSAPFGGRITIRGNRLIRAATMDPNWHFGVGAIWFYALERPIDAEVLLSDNEIVDPGCEAVQLLGPHSIARVTVDGLRVAGSATTPLAIQARGSLLAKRLVRSGPPQLVVEVPSNFDLVVASGNSGWSARAVARPQLPTCVNPQRSN